MYIVYATDDGLGLEKVFFMHWALFRIFIMEYPILWLFLGASLPLRLLSTLLVPTAGTVSRYPASCIRSVQPWFFLVLVLRVSDYRDLL
jgi:hypothetical protein